MRKTLHVDAGIHSPIGAFSIKTKDAFLGAMQKKYDVQFTVTTGTGGTPR